MHPQTWKLIRNVSFAIGFLAPVALMVSAQRREPPKPKNLKVLKNLPAGQLIPTMQAWNAALGVKCDFCHVIKPDHSGFDLDDKKEKRVAREMVTMTMDIRKHKVVGNKVTCFTCHHGHAEPEAPPTAGPGGVRR